MIGRALENFIGCWFNQDYDEGGQDFDQVILRATEGLSEADRLELAREARELRQSPLSVEEVDRVLDRAGMAIDPQAFAPDARAFLDRLAQAIEARG